jgi:hypothetical protein
MIAGPSWSVNKGERSLTSKARVRNRPARGRLIGSLAQCALSERARPGLGIVEPVFGPAAAPHLANTPNRFGVSDRHER